MQRLRWSYDVRIRVDDESCEKLVWGINEQFDNGLMVKRPERNGWGIQQARVMQGSSDVMKASDGRLSSRRDAEASVRGTDGLYTCRSVSEM